MAHERPLTKLTWINSALPGVKTTLDGSDSRNSSSRNFTFGEVGGGGERYSVREKSLVASKTGFMSQQGDQGGWELRFSPMTFIVDIDSMIVAPHPL